MILAERWLKLVACLMKGGWSWQHINYLYINVYYETDCLTKIYEWDYTENRRKEGRFIGAGLIHFTGKDNYERASEVYGMQFTPTIIAKDGTMDILACLWWLEHNRFQECTNLMDAVKKFKSQKVLDGKIQQAYTERLNKFLHTRRILHA